MALASTRLSITPKPLDAESAPSFAYSTRKLSSAYTGPCLRIRNSLTNVETDIFFTRGTLDIDALLTACPAGSDGSVVTWYSQVAGVANATQPVAAFQPILTKNGVLQTAAGKPALLFSNVEQRLVPPSGYTATASSEYSSSTVAILAFDRSLSTFGWQSGADVYANALYVGAVTTVVDGVSVPGEWIQVRIPVAGTVSALGITPGSGSLSVRAPAAFTLAASADNGATWTRLYSTATSPTYTGGVETRISVGASSPFSLYRLITSATPTNVVLIAELVLYGTCASSPPKEVSIVPLFAGAGTIQSVHGSYVATASSVYDNNTTNYRPGKIFDGDTSTFWLSTLGTYSNGTYTGAATTSVSGIGSVLGEWVQIDFPSPVCLRRYDVRPRTNYQTWMPKDFVVVGSNDGTTWTPVHQVTNVLAYTNGAFTPFTIPTPTGVQSFSKIRLIAQTIINTGSSVNFNLSEWRLYGYETATTPAFFEVPGLSTVPARLSASIAPSPLTKLRPVSPTHVRASSLASATTAAVRDCDASFATYYESAATYANGVYTGTAITTREDDAVPILGEFVEVRLPRAATLASYTLSPRPGLSASAPSSCVLVGSSDHGRTWVSLDTRTVLQSAYTDYRHTSFSVSTAQAYSTYRLIARSLFGGASAFSVSDWSLYGLPTTLETFLLAPTAVTASTTSLGAASALADLSILTAWTSAATYTDTYTGAVSTSVLGLGSVLGEYLQFSLASPQVLTRYDLAPARGNPTQAPLDFVLTGSLDATTWTVLDQQTVAAADWTLAESGAHCLTYSLASNTVAYASYRLIIRQVGTGATSCALSAVELYTTSSTAAAADMTLVPPLASASHGTGYGGVGGCTVSASTIPTSQSPHAVFAHPPSAIALTNDALTATYTDGVYSGAVSTNGLAGEWIQVTLPTPAFVSRLALAPSSTLANAPSAFTLLASADDGASWVTLLAPASLAQAAWVLDAPRMFDVSSNDAFTTYRLVFQTLYTSGVYPTLSGMQLYGRFVENVGSSPGVTPQRLTGLAGLSSSTSTSLVLSAPPGSSVVGLVGSTSSTLLQKMAVAYTTPKFRSARSTIISGLAAPYRKLRARLQDLAGVTPGTALAAWGSFAQSTQANQPVYALGSDGFPEVQFTGAQNHYLDGGQRTCNFGTNEGFTIVLYFKFTTADGSQQLFNSEEGNAFIRIKRGGVGDSRIYIQAANPSNTWLGTYVGGPWFTAGGAWQTNVWNVAVYRYRRINGTGFLQYIHNNVLNAELNMGVSAFENATYAITRLGTTSFTGSVRFAAMWDRALLDTELTALYASLVGNTRQVVRASRRLVTKPALALEASLGLTARQTLLEGRIARGFASIHALVTDLAALARPTTLPTLSPATLKVNSLDFGVPFEYAIVRSSQTISASTSLAPFFSSTKDTRPALVVVDGSLTIEAGATFLPAVRKLFTVLYVTGDLVVNGTISMTARGANHSGTGDSGGYVPPQTIRIYSGTWDGVTNPQIPAFGGAGSPSVYGNAIGGAGFPGANGGAGGGGAGGNGGTFASRCGGGAGGTAYSGGAGGGGSGSAFKGSDAQGFGGLGGANYTGISGQGAGNPVNGTGGTLVVIVGGLVSGSGLIQSYGSAASPQTIGSPVGGGGSGGGSVTVLANTGGELVGVTATGGGRGATRSGLGGDGSARLLRTLAGPIIAARVRDLSSLTNDAVVATWGSWTSASPTQPTYVAAGVDGKPEIAFDRSLPHYMTAGTRTFACGTNEGFTIVIHFKFTGTLLGSERLIEIGPTNGTSQSPKSIRLFRSGTTSRLRCTDLTSSSSRFDITSTVDAITDVWTVVAVRYRRAAGVGYCEMFFNNTQVAVENMGASLVPDRTDTLTYLGRSTWNDTSNFNGSMRFAGMWDRALSDAELTGLYTSLVT